MYVYNNGNNFTIITKPFDPIDGFKNKKGEVETEENLLKNGFLIDEIPKMPHDDFEYELCADFNSKKLFYRIKGVIGEDKEDDLQRRMIKLENDITVLQNDSIEQKYNELMKGLK